MRIIADIFSRISYSRDQCMLQRFLFIAQVFISMTAKKLMEYNLLEDLNLSYPYM